MTLHYMSSGNKPCRSWIVSFSFVMLPQMILWSEGLVAFWACGWIHMIKVSCDFADSSHSPKTFICQVTSWDHVIEGSYNFVVRGPLRWAITSSNLVAVNLVEVEIFFNLSPDLMRPSQIMTLSGWQPIIANQHHAMFEKYLWKSMFSFCHVTSRNHVTSCITRWLLTL